ncbi:MAG: DUF3656 domain-containing protein, partial [Firmicutes bacterium]|nr:DUF3656 domain-containing protein [Bacillota bacterium]
SLEKTGGTQYKLDKLTADIGEGLTLPSSALNDLRRRALEALEDYRSEGPEYHKRAVRDYHLPEYEAPGSREIRLRFESAEQFFDPGDGMLYSLPLSEIKKHKELISGSLICELPAVIYPMREDKILDDLKELKEAGLRSVLAENVAWIRLGKLAGLSVHGGASLNILNSESLEEYRTLGLEDAIVSFELAFSKFRKLEGESRRGAITYGRLPLMRFRSCPARGLKGCGSCSGRRSLTDRLNETFPLLCRERQYSELLNCVPLYVGDRKLPPMDFEVLWFTTESRGECREILDMYTKGEAAPFRRTAGLYYRELL